MSLTIVSKGSIDENYLMKVCNQTEIKNVIENCKAERAGARYFRNGYSDDRLMRNISQIPSDIYWCQLANNYKKDCAAAREPVDPATLQKLKDMDSRLRDIFHNPDRIERQKNTKRFLNGDFKGLACVDRV